MTRSDTRRPRDHAEPNASRPALSARPQAAATPISDPAAQAQFGHSFASLAIDAPAADAYAAPAADGYAAPAADGYAAAPIQRKPNATGLPDGLKSGVEGLSGLSLDDVSVHYNSDRPADVGALAYAQGADIHLGAGQEQHLPHEAWHVVQQKQGRVSPTLQAKGASINDDGGLEAEADAMGTRLGSASLTIPGQTSAPAAAPAHSAAPIQRMPKRKAFDKKITADLAQQTAIDNIGDAIDAYHQIKPKNDQDYQGRLTALADMERHLYGWFDANVIGTVAETTNGPHMKKILEENQAEHRKLVAKIAKKPALVPISTNGMQQGEVDAVRQTWRSVVNGTGNLTIKAGMFEGDFKDRQQANIAKLLQHPAGRDIVTNLSAPQNDPSKKVEIGSGFKSELKAFGRSDPKDSQAVPRTQDGDVSSMAFQKVARDTLGVTDVPVVNPGDRSSGPQNFNRFVNTLPGGTTHFDHEGDVYKTGTGVGSYVKMAGKGKMGTNVGTRMQETVVPEFVTLGHELGHSERMQKGTTVPFAEDMDKFGFQGTDTQKRLWNNSEEYVNIAGPENAIRAEHGIAGRQFHAGDLTEAKMPLQRSRLDDLLRHPLSAPKNGPTLPGYDQLFQTYSQMMQEPTEAGKKRLLMHPSVTQEMDTLEHHIHLAQNAPVNNVPVNNAPVDNNPVDDNPVDLNHRAMSMTSP